ncbi:MAG: GTPase, partial [Candidatus Aenigmatarchaeota archaeon]
MPANVTIEFMKAKEKYQKARTREEKIAALEEMLSTIPKHKGTENMQAEIKSKLSKLRKMKAPKVARHAFSLPKEGDAQVCIIGLTQSGKSTLLASLTNAKPKIAPRPYTTTKPK